MASGISSVVASASSLPPSGLTKTSHTVFCPMLPNLAGDAWGRDVTLHKLNVQEQINLVGLVRNGVITDAKNREAGDPDARSDDDESAQFWESVHLLVLGSADPCFSVEEAIQWVTLDEISGISCADVAQFLLVHIRSINDEQPGLEDLSAGLSIVRKMPYAAQAIEQAYDKGGDALDLLLEGKTPQSQEEMAAHLEKWGGIISHIVMNSFRKRARIEAEISTAMLMEKIVDLLCEMDYAKKLGAKESEGSEA